MELPTTFYTVTGFLFLSNIATIGMLFSLSFKAGRFVSATEAGIDNALNTGIRAHKRIDKLEDKPDLCRTP